jgi:hypothetical protein
MTAFPSSPLDKSEFSVSYAQVAPHYEPIELHVLRGERAVSSTLLYDPTDGDP